MIIARKFSIAALTAGLILTSACEGAPPSTMEDAQAALDDRQYRIARAHIANMYANGEQSDQLDMLQMQLMLELANGHGAMAAIEKLPESVLGGSDRRVAMAHAYILQGLPRKATEFYEELAPQLYTEQDFRMVLWALKEMDEVEDFSLGMDAALERFPQSADINALAGGALLDLGMADEAATYAATAMETDPDNLEVLLLNGRLAIFQDDLEKSLAIYTKASELYPAHAIPIANVAGLQMDLDLMDEAGATLDRGLQAHDEFPLMQWRKARYDYETGNLDGARAAIEKSRNAFADDPNFALLSGAIEEELGNDQMAIYEYQRYLREAGSDAEVEARIAELEG